MSRPPLPFAAAPYAHSMRLVELPRSIHKRTRQAVACPQNCRRHASVRYRSTVPSPTDPAELATPNSALRGCRARPTRSYALRKPIATPRQPRTTRVRAVRPTVSVTVSARQTRTPKRTRHPSRALRGCPALAPARGKPLAPSPTQTNPRSPHRALVAFCAAAGVSHETHEH